MVNLVAAVVALIALRVAARPADDNHHYGHGKAEYFSAGIEGLMIFVAAAVILVSAVHRFLHPSAIESVGIGLAISTVASVVNGAVGMLLIRAGRAHRSVTLTADGKHLLTDVWTSVGVIVGVLLVALTGWQRLDPVVAALVGVNILITGYRLVSQSVTSLLDAALPEEDVVRLTAVLDRLRTADVDFSDLRTRESGRHRFVALTVLVPGQLDRRAGPRRGRRGRDGDRRGPRAHRGADPHRAACPARGRCHRRAAPCRRRTAEDGACGQWPS